MDRTSRLFNPTPVLRTPTWATRHGWDNLFHPLTALQLGVDIVVALVMWSLTVPISVAIVEDFPGTIVLLVSTICTLALVFRHYCPEITAAIVALCLLLTLASHDGFIPLIFCAPAALYSVAAHGDKKLHKFFLFLAALGCLLGPARWTYSISMFNPVSVPVLLALYLVITSVIVALSWVAGLLRRQARANQEQRLEIARTSARAQNATIQLAAEEERGRIARDVHDVVAHSLALIVVQAEGGRYAAKAARDSDPAKSADAAIAALDTIVTAARESLAQTRTLVTTLRGDAPAETAPQQGIDNIPALVDSVREGDVDVALTIEGDPAVHAVPSQQVQVAAYRIAQECLTNMMKHAGPGARGAMLLRHTPEAVEVQMVNTVTAGAAATGAENSAGGHGLVGMAERAKNVGGSLMTGRGVGNEFTVFAHLPVPPAEDAAV